MPDPFLDVHRYGTEYIGQRHPLLQYSARVEHQRTLSHLDDRSVLLVN